MPSLTQLEYIIAVDRHRHFGRAAKECHVTQPSLSMQLQKFEEEIGVVIFDRSKKPILPTSKGVEIINQARVVLTEQKRLLEIAHKKVKIQGDFRLGVIPTISPYLIPLFAKDFSKSFPKVKLIVEEYQTEDIIKKLQDDLLDAALLVTPLNEDTLIERTLFYEPFYLFLSNNHKLLQKSQIKIDDLDGKDLWLLGDGHCFKNQMMKVCALRKERDVIANLHFFSGNLETLKNFVRQGIGSTLLPELALSDLRSNELKNNIREFSSPIPTREVSLVYSRSFLKEPIIDAIESCILNQLPRKIKSLKTKEVQIIPLN